MTLPAISVRNLGKMYRLAHQGKRTDSFREAITSTVLAPFRRISQLRGTDETQEEFWALKDVSFDVQPGEVVGIIGRNGAGKSTLLKILSRIVEPTEGEIRLRGRVASLLEVGTGFHPELTGRENIYLNGSILGMKRREIDKKFDEIVDFAEVEKFLDTPVKRYSSGMYVRLAFAVAAHLDPEILIVDEVLAVGDAEFQKKCIGKMNDVVVHGGRTVLFVSHNVAALQNLCTSGVFMQSGKCVATGGINYTLESYMNSAATVREDSQIQYFSQPRNSSLWMEKIEFNYHNGAYYRPEVGEKLTCRIWFRADHSIQHIEGMIIFHSTDGKKLYHLNSRYLPAIEFPTPLDRGVLEIEIPRLPLCEGNYTVTAEIGNQSIATHHAKECMQLTVEGRILPDASRPPHPNDGPVWGDCLFRIKNIGSPS